MKRMYVVELINYKDDGVYVGYHIIAESKKEAIAKAINDQMGVRRTPRYQIEIIEARVDD